MDTEDGDLGDPAFSTPEAPLLRPAFTSLQSNPVWSPHSESQPKQLLRHFHTPGPKTASVEEDLVSSFANVVQASLRGEEDPGRTVVSYANVLSQRAAQLR